MKGSNPSEQRSMKGSNPLEKGTAGPYSLAFLDGFSGLNKATSFGTETSNPSE